MQHTEPRSCVSPESIHQLPLNLQSRFDSQENDIVASQVVLSIQVQSQMHSMQCDLSAVEQTLSLTHNKVAQLCYPSKILFDRITDLPYELLILILSWLDPNKVFIYRRVCKAFDMCLLTKQFSVLAAPRYLFDNEALEGIRASYAHRFVYEGWFEQPISKLFKFPRYFQEVVVDDVFRGLEYLEINNIPNEIQSWRKDDQLIPAAFGRFSKLCHLSITSSEFKGPVPMEIWNMPNLKVLFFGMFPLNQPLLAEISGLKSLIALTMTDCLLYGSIPPEIGLLTSLRRLSLTDNKLTGNIPSELGNLSNLLELELCFNKLSGTIPIALGNLNKLLGFARK